MLVCLTLDASSEVHSSLSGQQELLLVLEHGKIITSVVVYLKFTAKSFDRSQVYLMVVFLASDREITSSSRSIQSKG